MKKYYWQCRKKNGQYAEGSYNLLRRCYGRAFLGERFTKIAEWVD